MQFFQPFTPKNEIDFVGKIPTMNKVFVAIPVLSIIALAVIGISWGLDFSGGTEMQVKFDKAVQSSEVRDVLASAGFDKNQVQQFGSAEDHEMLIRVERLTSLTDANIETIKGLLNDNFEELRAGSTLGKDSITVEFRVEEGDRVTLRLPAPVVSAPALNEDPAAVQTALEGALKAPADGVALDDTQIDALAGQGFSRAALAAKARELGYTVTATKTTDVEFSEAIALDDALEAQEAALAKLLDEKSGAKLRRTKRAGEEASIDDALVRSEPYQGKVKYLVHFRGVSVDIEKALTDRFGGAEIRRVEFVDAQVAQQLQTDGALAVIMALFFILIYVAIRFDVFFAPGAVIALLHDAIGALALFPLAGLEFELPSIAALLTVVGYSINNTIVIYDRIRETMPADPKSPLSEDQVKKNVNKAINDTISRTINTSLTTLFASLALYALAGGVVQNFAAVLSLGIVLGALSSTFLAPATYLFFRKNFYSAEPAAQKKSSGLSREDKARGVV